MERKLRKMEMKMMRENGMVIMSKRRRRGKRREIGEIRKI